MVFRSSRSIINTVNTRIHVDDIQIYLMYEDKFDNFNIYRLVFNL